MKKKLLGTLLFINLSAYLQTCQEGLLPACVSHVTCDPKLNEPDRDTGRTALQTAAFFGDFKEVQRLTSLGVDLDATTSRWENTALIESITFGLETEEEENYYDICQHLILHGANVNKPGWNGDTPVHYAVTYQNTFALLYLLQNNASINKKNNYNESPLDRAHEGAMGHTFTPESRKKTYRIAEILLDHGAISSRTLEPMPSDEIMQEQYDLVEIETVSGDETYELTEENLRLLPTRKQAL